ncbi:MAG: shikimate dehydrogenase [Chitinophagaceae bacterium]|nr:shikimate dehydrogenase [Chitinophagaceae bacterium]MBK8951561.1 shikimate dehydrogenase [Chitinophagaceae bacterium]
MRTYGLIGYPLSHSFSKQFFDEKFEKEGLIDCFFDNYSIKSIEDLLRKVIPGNLSLKGLAVTIPYKQAVLPFLHNADGIPPGLNACNCIRIIDGKLFGFNTDYIGFRESFRVGIKHHHTSALVLGNGGATAAVVYALRQLGISYSIVSRQLHNGAQYVYEDLTTEIIAKTQIIINTTPLGMYPAVDSCPPIQYNSITAEHYLYDLVYNPDETLFLNKGKKQGASIKNGSDMLVIQAEENWKIWNS